MAKRLASRQYHLGMRRFVALVIVAGVLIGVASVPRAALLAAGQSRSLGEPFTLKPGESASVGVERVQVGFERVVSDSRCPKDVQCIQAGEAVVHVRVIVPGRAREDVDLSTNHARDNARTGDYTISLTALEPVPLAGKPTRVSDYRATFVLRRQ